MRFDVRWAYTSRVNLMEWVSEHQYSKISKNLWTCWCSDEPLKFASWDELVTHLKESLARDVLGRLLNNVAVIAAWRTAYDGNEVDSTWQHDSDAAIVAFVAELLGLNDDAKKDK